VRSGSVVGGFHDPPDIEMVLLADPDEVRPSLHIVTANERALDPPGGRGLRWMGSFFGNWTMLWVTEPWRA